jgi:ABC-type lipoprotein release transport system permease subunit
MKKILIHLAWKNVWRNKLRSGTILGAIAVGLFAGTFMSALMSGWIITSVEADIRNQLSYIQIHQEGFSEDQDINAWFMQTEAEEAIRKIPEITQASFRLKINGMLASAANVAGISVRAVDVTSETATSTLNQAIPDSCGSFLTEGKMPVVISKKIAEKLKVRLKSKIVLTFQDTEGEMQSLAFRVGGIFKTSNSAFDKGTIYVRKSDIFALTGLPEGAVHEAALMVDDLEMAPIASDKLKAQLSGVEIQRWDEIQPELGLMYSWIGLMTTIFLAVFLLALSFGIINTMLMAVLDRTRELGMLGAIGMSKRRIFNMIMLETVFLTCVGSFIGIILGGIVIGLTSRSGIDLTFMGGDLFDDYGYVSVVYPTMHVKMFVQIVVLVILTGFLSAIYPARKALKLNSLEAIRL